MAYRTIVIKGKDRCIFKEGVAAGAITPGHLLAGLPAAVTAHGTAAAAAMPMFAVEDELQGKEISEAYASTENVRYGVMPAGTELAAIASGTVTAGEYVESAGTGALRTLAAGVALGRALTTATTGNRFTLEVL